MNEMIPWSMLGGLRCLKSSTTAIVKGARLQPGSDRPYDDARAYHTMLGSGIGDRPYRPLEGPVTDAA
jgi:hypothetical protein